MKNHLEDYLEVKDFKYDDPKLVVADFQMEKAPNGKKAKAEYKIKDNGLGGKYIYYPLMANKYAPVDQGKMLETSQDAYIVTGDATDQL